MNEDGSCSQDQEVLRIRKRFINVVNKIRSSNGIELTRDTEAPEQAPLLCLTLGSLLCPYQRGLRLSNSSKHSAWLC
ncbi:MAG: hypothetical protein DF168_01042 [Candidatus Moanabacter tarae]|uniref:Uncharacterized protein n=1 Tax=Candidatus Moanibacter tarae TaxID=2200854 RepID=A0A2Z4AFR1_9BACT|nr:MAG: hypothetical protein DF168_01042 [Candidatus Moanabacter tarae]